MKKENGMTATPVQPIVLRSSRVTCTLYCGDCLDLLPIESDAVVTDPPYGLGLARAIHCTKPSRPNTYLTEPKYETKEWDDERPSKATFDAMLASAAIVVIWGGNYFADMLPASRGWLYWSKMFENTTNFSHGELAWTSVEIRICVSWTFQC